MSFQNMMENALDINKNTSPEAIQNEKDNMKDDTIILDNSEFLYPTIIIIPMVIVLISILTLNISLIAKFTLFILLCISLIVYVLQFKKYNIVEPLKTWSDNINNKFRNNDSIRETSSLGFKD